MNPALKLAVERALSGACGAEARIAKTREVGGGCINQVEEVRTEDGRRFLLKSNSKAPAGFFEREIEGLRAIREAGAVRAPEPLAAGGGEGDVPRFLVMEFIDSAAPRADFDQTFGRALAQMHRAEADRFGLGIDNFLGASPQANAWSDSWPAFFREARLGGQLRLLEKRGYATAELAQKLGKLMDRLDDLLGGGREVRPALLHGDLWSGNIMSDESGGPAIVDPAVYHGDREADLAMTELFGRLDANFYGAYREAYPLASGYEERREIYNLYHLLNHLNLFGLSYMSGVMATLRRFGG